MTRGIHILSTVPGRKVRGGMPYVPEYFELVCMALSSLKWRKLNGPMTLYCDRTAYTWFEEHDLLSLWDDVNTDVIESIPDSINQEVFWAGCKLFALRDAKAPVVMVDTDLVVWKRLDRKLFTPVTVLHKEDIVDCYLPKEYLKIRKGYEFDPDWDWSVRPCNTALAYFADDAFKEDYTRKAIDFMTDNRDLPMENVSQMVFAEQRLLAMEAARQGLEVSEIVRDPFQAGNDIFTHLWGAKRIARTQPDQREMLINALLNSVRRTDRTFYEKLGALRPVTQG